jgi:hypothetical protein
MLSRSRRRPHRACEEAGFTLIEVMVAALTGVVVIGALFAILDVSLHQTSLLSDKVQADQVGRTGMTKLVEQLHSACIAPGFTPIQATSGPSSLVFINAYSEGAVISRATEHQVVWNESAGTLTDYTYLSKIESGSEWPTFKFPALDYSSATRQAANATPPAGILLATNVSAVPGNTGIFKYFQYAQKSSAAGENLPIGSLESLALTESNTAKAASVLISFRAGARDGRTTANRSVDLTSQVTFAVGAPASETPIEDSPCH